jgi:hypothetical protein
MPRSNSPPPRRAKSVLSPHKGDPVAEPVPKLRASGRVSVRPLTFHCSQFGNGPSRGLVSYHFRAARSYLSMWNHCTTEILRERAVGRSVFPHAHRQMMRPWSPWRLRPSSAGLSLSHPALLRRPARCPRRLACRRLRAAHRGALLLCRAQRRLLLLPLCHNRGHRSRPGPWPRSSR